MKHDPRLTQLTRSLFASLTVAAMIGCVTQEQVPKSAGVLQKPNGKIVSGDSDTDHVHRKATADSRANKKKSKATSSAAAKTIEPQTTKNATVKLEGDDVKLEGN
jgi:hypothetical protein